MSSVATDVSSSVVPSAWSLRDNDRALLGRLITDVRRLLALASPTPRSWRWASEVVETLRV
jgi:hypothetical protein